MAYGYAGKMLIINLTDHTITEQLLDRSLQTLYLSGTGFNARILYDNIPPGADPLGPENVLIFSTGVFCGTNIPTACRTEVSSLSPATGLFGTSSSGNYWGGELKFAGFDVIVLKGKSEKPVYLQINDSKVKIISAQNIWGLDAWETIRAIRSKQNAEAQVACIGQAGENMVRYASIENGPYDAWARTGLGAVMGSKNLKAIAVKGTGAVRVAHKNEFLRAVNKTRQAIMDSPFYKPFSKYGTMLVTIPYQEHSILPGRNYQTGTIEGWESTRTRKQLHHYTKRGVACMACPIACAHWVEIKDGPYADLQLKDMEVTPVIAFGAGCDIDNLPAVAKLTEVCQRLGLDMVSAAGAVAFSMELYQKAIIDESELGFKLNWGNQKSTIKLLENIAHRKGFGDILAEGTKRAAEKIAGSEKYCVHVKGLECMLIDPRARWSTWTLGYITNIRGGDHLRTRNPVENLRHNDNPRPYRTEKFSFPDEMLQTLDMPDALKERVFDPKTGDVDIPQMSKWSEDLISVYNAVGLCIRPPVLHTVGPTLISEMYAALTGIHISPEEIIKAGERTWNLQKLFNSRHGEKPEDSRFPDRFYNEPSSSGKTLDREKVAEVLKEYYKARGWDQETGCPLPDKLQELDLTNQ